MNKIKDITLFGLIALLLLVFTSGASAEMMCVDFEDNTSMDVAPGESVEGMYWNDVLWINSTTGTASLVAENNTALLAYQADESSNTNAYVNGYLTGNGISQTTILEEEIYEFTFADSTLADNFSLQLFDFGDYDKFGSGYLNATLIAYDTSGTQIDFDSIDFTGSSEINSDNDAQYGPLTLEVEGEGIATVKLINNPNEASAIDNICFNAYDATLNTYCLFAGQDIPIGTVDVWHDCENLYLKYTINEEYDDWYFTETHFDIADEVSDIPQTKQQQNPIPGKFSYGNDSLDYVKEYSEKIPLNNLIDDIGQEDFCDGITFATHAKVVEISDEEMLVYSDAGSSITWDNGTATGDAVAAWEHPKWNKDFTSVGDWIWESEYVWDYKTDTTVNFTHGFFIPGFSPAGSINITCDNIYDLYLNDENIGADDDLSSVEHYDISDSLLSGENELLITATNVGRPDLSVTANPAGVVYEAQITYKQQTGEESAWGADCEDPLEFNVKKNWATYFEYTPFCSLCEDE